MVSSAVDRSASRPGLDDLLPGLLAHRLPVPTGYWVGFSGGLDSRVLLQLLVEARDVLAAPIAAIHVDHGLQPGAAHWADHCRAECERLQIPLTVLRVDAVAWHGESPEAVARAARYAAIADAMGPGGMLLTAHHRDDQAETLLLQLLRGAGVEGLAAMSQVRAWRQGWHARPLLGMSRAAIRAWAVDRALRWIEDPSNAETHADRNYLRHEVMPRLRARWAGADAALARSAAHCAEAADLVGQLAEQDLQTARCSDPGCLQLEPLRRLPPARARALLRRWIRGLGLPLPPTRRLIEALEQLRSARPDAAPCVDWDGVALRRFRDRAWLVPAKLPDAPIRPLDWTGEELRPGPGLGRITRRLAPDGIDRSRWAQGRVQVGYREPGLQLRPAGRDGCRPFKNLAQDCAIPPWWRALTPLILIDGQPAAVANCCVCEPFAAVPGEPGWMIEWTPDGVATAGNAICPAEPDLKGF